MAEELYEIGSPVDAKNRRIVNMTYDDILARFNDFQRQINILYGGKAAQDILDSIESAIQTANNANSDAQAAVNKANTAINQLTVLISNTNASAQRAENAADDVDQMKQILTVLKGELEQLQIDLNSIVQAEAQRAANENSRIDSEINREANEDERKDAENERALAEQSRVNAETNRETAEQSRNDAEVIRQQKLAELLDILNELDFKGEYDPAVDYKAFNVVRFGRASYVALKDVSGVTPSDDGINWRTLAAGGIDGAGAVSTVNNIQPDNTGNINLIIDYINNVTSDRIDAGLSAAMGTFLMSLITALQNDKVDAAFVDAEVNRLIAAAPGMLDTFEEIANALNNDPNFANTIITLLNEKASNVALGQTNDSLAQTNNNLSTLQQRVTTHLDKFVQNLSDSGYQKLPNGLIIQWATYGEYGDADQDVIKVVNLPITFPNRAFYATADLYSWHTTLKRYVQTTSNNDSQVSFIAKGIEPINGNTNTGGFYVKVIAIGH